jgi:hypothetical protein
MNAFATWVPPHRRRRNVISPDLNWEHLELREAPWRDSYGLTQVFHRSMLELSDLWKVISRSFWWSGNEPRSMDQISFLLAWTDAFN